MLGSKHDNVIEIEAAGEVLGKKGRVAALFSSESKSIAALMLTGCQDASQYLNKAPWGSPSQIKQYLCTRRYNSLLYLLSPYSKAKPERNVIRCLLQPELRSRKSRAAAEMLQGGELEPSPQGPQFSCLNLNPTAATHKSHRDAGALRHLLTPGLLQRPPKPSWSICQQRRSRRSTAGSTTLHSQRYLVKPGSLWARVGSAVHPHAPLVSNNGPFAAFFFF